MIIGSTKEDISLEKRIALTPDAAKNIIGLGLNICIEKNYAAHLGIKDEDFKRAGVEIKSSSKEVLETCNLLIKVNFPQNDEINNLKEKSFLNWRKRVDNRKTKHQALSDSDKKRFKSKSQRQISFNRHK